MAHALTIGQVAQAAGVSARTIRYYEQVGVLPAPGRTTAGYRQYTPQGVGRLIFVRRARALGLSLQNVRALSAALDGPRRGVRPRLRVLVRAQLSAVRRQRVELQVLQGQLAQVLRRLRSPRLRVPARRDQSGRCRCLDTDRGA